MTPLQERIYNRLSTRSRRAITRKYKKYGHLYNYSPRGTLLENIAFEFGISKDQVYFELMNIRQEILKNHSL